MILVLKSYYFFKHLVKNEITMFYFISTLKLIFIKIISTFIQNLLIKIIFNLIENYTNHYFKIKLIKNKI